MPTDYAIKDGRTVFEAATYTGDGTSTRTVTTSPNFTPDLFWLKNRTDGFSHLLYDTIRGAGENADLASNTTAVEGDNNTNSTYGYVSALNSNGISVVKGSNSTGYTNTSGSNYVAWQWKAGGTAVSNTAGSITSSVSANTTAGFSIVTYTGTGTTGTVGHGLGVAPKMVIVKCRNTAGESWQVYHSGLTSAAYRMRLNAADAQDSQPTMWNSTAPTSTVFSVGTATGTNANTQTYVAYCWADVNGFSKLGSYTGNGSTDGTFVYTGFRPKYILIKRTDAATYQWAIWDTTRNTFNAANSNLWADSAEAETTSSGYDVDIISNGFKLRTTNVARNASGGTYIYAAFAENPFKYANAR